MQPQHPCGTLESRNKIFGCTDQELYITLYPLDHYPLLYRACVHTEKFIVFSALCFASPAACCWCRVSCCLFLEMKSFGFDEIQSLQVTPG